MQSGSPYDDGKAVHVEGETMSQQRLAVRARRPGGRDSWLKRASLPVILVAIITIPLSTASASAPRGGATKEVVKVGIITPVSSPTAANPDSGDAFNAAIKAFNKRGGVGVNGARIRGIVCDSRGDANREVECARQMEEEGVVATINDLAYNNPSGVVEVMEAAGIPRIGLGPTDVSEFVSSVSYPISAGIIAAYIGDALGFEEDGNTTVTLVRTDAPTGASFRGFVAPLFEAAGVEIVGDVALATGATDYAPYVADIQRIDADAVLLSIDDTAATQLIAAMAQLNVKIPLGGHPGTFALETLRKYKDITKGTVLSESFPFPSGNNIKRFPGLKQFFADMKASGKENLQPKNIQTTSFYPWVSMLAFVNLTKDLDTFTKETVTEALQTVQDVDLMGLTPPWTPSTPGFGLFESSSNHFVYISRFNGKNVVTDDEAIDITQYTG
jgi:ABC-type branched-subunit amino acid transport system substrate-binding protein